ncbi:MAG: hypothetical protein Ta2A_18150 [Treponemataceae bacterium]|nr:MAG: hypothetical protein Ta2A_18150 [Treponemataceae bacterium]
MEKALGQVGMVGFIQQHKNGYGDYTKEKYQHPDLTVEDIDAMLKNK